MAAQLLPPTVKRRAGSVQWSRDFMSEAGRNIATDVVLLLQGLSRAVASRGWGLVSGADERQAEEYMGLSQRRENKVSAGTKRADGETDAGVHYFRI